MMSDTEDSRDDRLELVLLPPLWSLVAEYFDFAERWYYSSVTFFRLSACEPDNDATTCVDAVVVGNHMHILQPLYRRMVAINSGWRFNVDVVTHMVCLDRAAMLEFVHDHQPRDLTHFYNNYGNYDSAETGALEVLRWEQRRGYRPWNSHTALSLASRGHLFALQQLRGAGCPWDHQTFTAAVEENQLDVVKWLTTTDLDTSRVALEIHINSLKMLKYFVEDNAPKYPLACVVRHILTFGSPEMREYMFGLPKKVMALETHQALDSVLLPSLVGIVTAYVR